MSESMPFYLLPQDISFIRLATATARKLLRRVIKNEDGIISFNKAGGLKNAIKGFDQLPEIPHGISCLFGLVLKEAKDNPRESGYIRFIIAEDRFGVYVGDEGSRTAFLRGTNLKYKWITKSNGYHEDGCGLGEIEELVYSYIRQGADIVVENNIWEPLKDDFWCLWRN